MKNLSEINLNNSTTVGSKNEIMYSSSNKLALMSKYKLYKDSEIDWLGKIPDDWDVKRFKFLLKEINIRSNTGGELLLSLSKYKGVVPKNSLKEKSGTAESLVGYKKVFVNDLVINKMQAVNGLFAISQLEGITSPDYAVYRPLNNDSLDVRYLGYMLSMPEYLGEFKRRVTGVMEGFIRLYTDDLYSIYSILPSIDQQSLIANFLDKKTAQIDAVIAFKEQQINLLKERKQIIIQKAVTQGLDPNVPMKDSGVDWIGMIPEHWETERSRWLFRQRKEKARKSDEQLTASQKYGVISQQKFMELEGRRVTQVELNSEILKHVEANDFVISMRSFQGGVEYCAYTGCVSSAYVPLIPCELVHSPYYKHLLKSQRYIEALQCTSNLVRDGQALRYENFCMVDLLIVPFEEQIAIANFIDNQEKLFRRNISIMKAQIEKLKEYKITLINSAVTGKIRITPEMV